MTISQDDRLIRIDTPLGKETFVVLSFDGTEAISRMFNFSLELASEHNDITFEQMAGGNVTVHIRSGKSQERLFNGIIIAFAPIEVSAEKGYSLYRAVMAPALWGLTECYDCRIFQDKDVKEIISEVLSKAILDSKKINRSIDYRLELTGTFIKREYCVQYAESDFDFVSRLCEEEGIFYFFEHQEASHVLVFADSPDKHRPYATGDKETVTFQKSTGAYLKDHVITALHANKKLTAASYTARDYNFITPEIDMTVTKPTLQQISKSEGEIYNYPGGYALSSSAGENLAKIRMQARDAQICNIYGQGNCPDFIPGYKFKLREHPLNEMNVQSYVLTMVHHQASQDFRSGTSNGDQYYNSFNCIPHAVPFRPEQSTPKPLIVSSQTAIITGPKAEEIHTDKFGRVKVKFFWDRRNDEKGDGNMSCWIRVSQNWAGGKWGAMHIPRVGQEVIVNFLDGDPDRPIITGRVYHGKNLPPYDLPAHKTKSTIMSNSSKNGGNFNEIRFEDLAGKEELFTHAAKDQNEVVENDMSTEVKANQAIKVEKNRNLTVASGTETITIAGGGRSVAVKAGENHTNSAGFNHKVAADYTLKVNGNITIDASGLVKITGEYCDHNLSGKGFYSAKTKANLAGKPLPLIEDPQHLIQSPADRPPIAGLGFYHRAWLPRARYAGTFDKAWRAERGPRMPADFNYRFYNGAHPDLQVKGYLDGNEPVELVSLTPEGHMRFALPGITPLCRVLRARQKEEQKIVMRLDTVFIEPSRYRFHLVWRGAAPLAALTDAGIEQVSIQNDA